MSFMDDVNAFANDLDDRAKRIHSTTVELAKQSIQFGSPLTGASGQPVDTNNLRNSWQREDISDTEATVSTNVEYAQAIEDGIGPNGPLTLRSAVGGFHSVKATVANFDKIVDAAVKAHGG